jgi:hypothetical protein
MKNLLAHFHASCAAYISSVPLEIELLTAGVKKIGILGIFFSDESKSGILDKMWR